MFKAIKWYFSASRKKVQEYKQMMPTVSEINAAKLELHKEHKLEIGYWDSINVTLMCMECEGHGAFIHEFKDRSLLKLPSGFSLDKLT